MRHLFVLFALGLAAAVPLTSFALTDDEWREDAAFACREMPKRHVNLFHTLKPADFDAHCARLATSLDGLPEHRRVLAIAELVARVGDGHSRLTLPMDPAAGFFLGHTPTVQAAIEPFRYLPIRLAALADGWLIVRATEEHRALLGASVVRVGGRTVAELEPALDPVIQRDNAHQLAELRPLFAVVPEVLEARGIVSTMDAVPWTVRHADGREESVVLRPVAAGAKTAWIDFQPAGGTPLYLTRPQENYWFVQLPGTRTTYLRFSEVIEQPVETIAAFASRLYQSIEDSGSERLIIDLRGNPGGSNDFNTPIALGAIRATRLWQPGGLFVVTDGGTFSAAMNLANDLERWTPAIFAGAPTGARPNSYGDAKKLELPRSHLTIRLSSLYWQDSSPFDKRDAIGPILAVETTIADARAGRDPVLPAIAAFDGPPAPAAGDWSGQLSGGYLRSALALRIESHDGTLAAEADMPGLRVERRAFDQIVERAGELSGSLMLGKRRAPFAARVTRARMSGWFEYLGERYPFVAWRVVE